MVSIFVSNVNMVTFLSFAIFSLFFVPIQAGHHKLRKSMQNEQIIPDIIDAPPEHLLTINYEQDVEVYLGNELTPTEVSHAPVLVNWHAHHRSLYTLIMVDTDSLNGTQHRECLHWLIVNIPGLERTEGDIYAEYIGPGPPEGSGLHQYVLLVFKQTNKLTLNRPKISSTSMDGRMNFKVRDFCKENNLQGPVAGNFFKAKYDSLVPILHAQLRRKQ